MPGLSLGLGLGLSSRSRGVEVFSDFRQQMPAGSTYTRTGAATGLTLAGLIQSFAADAPQRTDRGLALEPAGTNLLPRYGPTVAQLVSPVSVSNTTEPSSPPISGLNWLLLDNTVGAASAYQTATVAASTNYAPFVLVETPDGSTPVVGETNSTGDFRFVVGTNIITGTVTYRRLSGNVWLVSLVGTSPGSPTTANGVIRFTAQNQRVLKFSGFDLKLSPATSPIITTGAAATRGLPVFTESVPAGRTKALLTYADGTSTLVTGLTPGGTFDVATAVIGAGKGVFGTSELITREWRA